MNTASLSPSPTPTGSFENHKRLSALCGIGSGLVFGLMFALPSGYSYGAALLLLTSLWVACSPAYQPWRASAPLALEDRVIAWVLLAYFLAAAASKAWQANSVDNLDQPLRAALVIPVLWMLVRQSYDFRWVWSGVVIGALSCAAMSAWELHVLGLPRAEGFLNVIHLGNIALVFGAFCATGLIWAASRPTQTRLAWRLAFLAGLACSAYGVIASGSRGSWVAIPALVFLYGLAFLSRRNILWAAGVAVTGLSAVVLLFSLPDSPLKERYDAAVQDIRLYQQGDATTSVGARFEMWEGAIKSIGERPFRGWNHADYHARLEEMVENGELDAIALEFSDNLHNSYLHAQTFQGLPGLLALLAMYFVPLAGFCRRLRHSDLAIRSLAYCGAALCSSYIFFSMSQVLLKRNNGIMFYVLALVIFWGALRVRERNL